MMENVRTMGSRLLGVMVAVFMAIAMAAAVAALPAKAYADEAAVRDVANGVLKLNWHVDGEDYSRGSCFLINDQTVVTAYHCTFFSKNELDARGVYGSDVQELRDHMTYSVSINRDVKVGATLVNYSEEQDFAILKLDQPLNGYKALTFRDSSTVEAAETVYSVGFPANSDLKAIKSYTADDATFKRGTISKPEGLYQGTMNFWFDVNGYFLQTDCPISGGDSGGPMVDVNGNVEGISVMGNESFYFCVGSDVVTPVLKTLGIEYKEVGPGGSTTTNASTTGGSSSAASPAAETYALSFTALDSAISKAKDLKSDEYTAESFQAVTTALAAAEDAKKLELADDSDKAAYEEAQAKIDKAVSDLNDAMSADKLQKKPEGLPTAAIIGIIVAIVALIAIIAAIMASRKKKGAQPAAPAAQAPMGAPAPAAPAAAQPALQSGAQTWQKPAAEGAAETTILEDEASDTVILFQAASGGSLTRMSTNEQIPINSAEFTIGRERSKVNYCLEGNSSISRIHVRIVVRDGKVYLVDNKAANGTFVNGVKCRPGEEVLLKGGDIITLADEKFKYNS